MMLNRRVRMVALAVALLMSFFAVLAEGNAEPDAGELKDKLLSDFYDYSYAQEMIYGDVLWAISCFEQYDQARSWDRLQIARAAASAALTDVSGRELPQQRMSADDYSALLLFNVDATFMELSSEDYLSDQRLMGNDLKVILRRLTDAVFESRGWENSVKHVGLIRELVEGYLQYWANTVDWLMQEIDDEQRAEAFSALLAQNCPAVASRRAKNAVGQAELEAVTDQLLTQMQGVLDAMAELMGQRQADLALFEDAVRAGNVAEGIGEVNRIDGLPTLLPWPEWEEDFTGQSVAYGWKNEDGSLRSVAVGELIDVPPNICEIKMSGVSREELERYRERLTSMGITCPDGGEGDGVLTLNYSFSGGRLIFECQGDTLTVRLLDDPVCFAPEWYLSGP